MEQQLTVTSILSLFETTKDQRTSFVNQIIQLVQNGELDLRKMLLQIKCVQDLAEQIMSHKTIKNEMINECQKYGKKHQYHKATIEIKEAGTKYDYKKCNDLRYEELIRHKENIETELKERTAFLKKIPEKGLILTDPITGETTTVYPPSKSSTTTVAVTLE